MLAMSVGDMFASHMTATGTVPSWAAALPSVVHKRTVHQAGSSGLCNVLDINIRLFGYVDELFVRVLLTTASVVSRFSEVVRWEALVWVLVKKAVFCGTIGNDHGIDVYYKHHPNPPIVPDHLKNAQAN